MTDARDKRYLFGHAHERERQRLGAMQSSMDPFSIRIFDVIGLKEGWRCLEVGAGAGSLAAWLCNAVGADGRVVATDLETGFLEELDAANLDVRRHDIARDALEEEAFDLVHARKVLEHLPVPRPAIERMAAAVRPGGWLVVEDGDLTCLRHVECRDPDFFWRGYAAFLDTMATAGFDPGLGIHLGGHLRSLGLEQVEMTGTCGEWTGAGEKPSVFAMTFERVRERVIERGLLEADEVERFFADLRSPGFRAITAVHFGAWGRRP
jgi:SAM-dependent methyltransferase